MKKGWFGDNIFKGLDPGYSAGAENVRPQAYSFLERNPGGRPFLNVNIEKELKKANEKAQNAPLKISDELDKEMIKQSMHSRHRS